MPNGPQPTWAWLKFQKTQTSKSCCCFQKVGTMARNHILPWPAGCFLGLWVAGWGLGAKNMMEHREHREHPNYHHFPRNYHFWGICIYIYGTIYTVFRPTHFLYFLFVLNGKTPYQAWCKNCHDCSASEDLYKDGAAPTSQDLWSLSLTFVFLKVGDLLSLLHGRWQLRVTNVLIHLWMLEDYTGTSFKKPL